MNIFYIKGKSIMKNILKLIVLLMIPTGYTHAEVTGGLGYSSDYFFRGTSQTSGHPSASAWLDWNNDKGMYVGAWTGQVDFNDDASIESNLYLGYGTSLTDNLSYDIGIIQYRYNHDYDNLQEVYVGLSYNNLSVYHYVDTDTKVDFTQLTYNLEFVPVVDASISYSFTDRNTDHFQLDIDYAINDSFTLGLDVMEEIIDGDYSVDNTVAVGISYSF